MCWKIEKTHKYHGFWRLGTSSPAPSSQPQGKQSQGTTKGLFTLRGILASADGSVELCPPHPRFIVQVLTLRTPECDLIWKRGGYRCDWLRRGCAGDLITRGYRQTHRGETCRVFSDMTKQRPETDPRQTSPGHLGGARLCLHLNTTGVRKFLLLKPLGLCALFPQPQDTNEIAGVGTERDASLNPISPEGCSGMEHLFPPEHSLVAAAQPPKTSHNPSLHSQGLPWGIIPLGL